MATNQGINIARYLTGETIKNNAKMFTAIPSNIKNTYVNTAPITKSSVARVLSYFLAILIIITVILLFINYFITPIFQLTPGGPGIIPVPGFDDGILFWNKTSAGHILNKDLPIAAQVYGYTINLDIFIENPLQFSKHPRIIFSRGAVRNEVPQGDTLLGILNNYNIVAALLPDTNDLIVSVLNKDNNMESVIISNIQVQEPFRLTMVVMEQALEVYVNGYLMKTRTFLTPPKDVKGDIYPAMGIEANVVKVRNLKIWARLLKVSEIRNATPALSTTKDFGGIPMPTSSTGCTTSSSSTKTDIEKGMDRFTKLSVDTIPDISSQIQ